MTIDELLKILHENYPYGYEFGKIAGVDMKIKELENNQDIIMKLNEFWSGLAVKDGLITNRHAYDELRNILHTTKQTGGST